ncbi:MAG: hypothetical protein ACRDLN_11710, partial [Solirubrobacteraceae bacterium]
SGVLAAGVASPPALWLPCVWVEHPPIVRAARIAETDASVCPTVGRSRPMLVAGADRQAFRAAAATAGGGEADRRSRLMP